MAKLPREANYVGQNQNAQLTPAQSRRTKHKEHTGATGGPLLSEQFQPMSAIKRAYSVDRPGTVEKGLIPDKRDQVARGEGITADYPALAKTMKTGGPTAIPPVHWGTVDSMNRDYGHKGEPGMPGIAHLNSAHLVGKGDKPTLGNGGHRTAIASDLGWKAMPVTRNEGDSGYAITDYDKEEGDTGDSHGLSSANTSASYSHQSVSGGLHPGDRSFVPGGHQSDIHGKDAGARWHADGALGGKTPGKGLYSQLHPAQPAAGAPLTNHLNSQQFADTKMGVQHGPAHPANIAAKYQQSPLPGMTAAPKLSLSQALHNAIAGQ